MRAAATPCGLQSREAGRSAHGQLASSCQIRSTPRLRKAETKCPPVPCLVFQLYINPSRSTSSLVPSTYLVRSLCTLPSLHQAGCKRSLPNLIVIGFNERADPAILCDVKKKGVRTQRSRDQANMTRNTPVPVADGWLWI